MNKETIIERFNALNPDSLVGQERFNEIMTYIMEQDEKTAVDLFMELRAINGKKLYHFTRNLSGGLFTDVVKRISPYINPELYNMKVVYKGINPENPDHLPAFETIIDTVIKKDNQDALEHLQYLKALGGRDKFKKFLVAISDTETFKNLVDKLETDVLGD